jgi:type 1 glutamine amidotransferase
MRSRIGAALLTALLAVSGCSSGTDRSAMPPSATAPGQQSAPVRVMVLTATRGFRHGSIGAAREVMNTMGAAGGEFAVTTTEDVSTITAATLARYDVLCFILTTGELPFDDEQRRAIVNFVSAGKGFVGIHSAADTLYDWPDYGRLVGAYFKEHPWTQAATVLVEDGSHPSTAGLGDRFTLTEEFYTFRDNPRGVQVLLRLDPSSVGGSGDFPLAWAHTFGAGRAYYNALGHFDETWRDGRFQRQLAGALRWAAGR